jgi:hypothetical protein
MYQLVSAIARSNVPGAHWGDLAIASITMGELFSQYEKVYARLTNPFYTGVRVLDLDDVRALDPIPTQTFAEFLTSTGTGTLPVQQISVSFNTKYARYSDVFKARYNIDPISPLGHIGSTILLEDRDWLSITPQRSGIDMRDFFKYCLVTVNGFVHRTDADSQRVYVIDGMKTCRIANMNTCGMISFAKVGALEFVSITPDMIYKRDNAVPYKSRMYIDAQTARPGKTAFLVLGGYLHAMDGKTFNQVGDATFSINFQNFPLRDRYFDSYKTIDLTPLGLDHQPSNPVRIDDAELHSDEVLVKYATLSQSFIVFVDNPHVFVEREALPRSDLLNTYIGYEKPVWPIIVQAGKLSDYWSVEEAGRWAITCKDGNRNNYDYNTTLEENIVCIDDARTPQDPTTMSLAHYLKMGTDVLVQTGA